jgi:hypothetical protein
LISTIATWGCDCRKTVSSRGYCGDDGTGAELQVARSAAISRWLARRAFNAAMAGLLVLSLVPVLRQL